MEGLGVGLPTARPCKQMRTFTSGRTGARLGSAAGFVPADAELLC
jgi:hypothetical protein